MDRRSELALGLGVTSSGTLGPSCPVAPELTDSAAGRIAAFLSLGFLALVLWRGWGLAALGLTADFGFRALGLPAFSLAARSATVIRRLLGLPARPVNAGPKRFAASVGCLFSLGVAVALLAGFRSLGIGLGIVLGACAGLEACFGFCLACQIHPWLTLAWVRLAR